MHISTFLGLFFKFGFSQKKHRYLLNSLNYDKNKAHTYNMTSHLQSGPVIRSTLGKVRILPKQQIHINFKTSLIY